MSARRLLVLLEPGAGAELERAMELAKRLDARLEAVVLDDEQLHRAARLPFSREIGLTSAQTTNLNQIDLDSRLRAGLAELKRRLAASAARNAVDWTLAVRKGRIAEQLLEAERTADFLAVAGSSMRGAGALSRLLLGGALTTRQVFVLRAQDAGETKLGRTAVLALGGLDANALDLARSLTSELRSPEQLAIFVPPHVIEPPAVGEDDVAFRLQPGLWTAQQLLARMQDAGAAAVIAIPDPSCADCDREALESLVAASRLPIAILTIGRAST